MRKILISLGSNKDDRSFYIKKMILHLKEIMEPPFSFSQLMVTEPVGIAHSQGWFFNCLMSGYYTDSILQLLDQCQTIERVLGRTEKNTKKARTADIDILWVENYIAHEEFLEVPHPELINRRFCLEGAFQIMPDAIHPTFNMSFDQLYKNYGARVKNQKIRFYPIG